MPQVRRLPAAQDDLDEIWDYISQNSPASATRLLRRIDRVCDMLSDNPYIGRARSELAPGLRSFPVGSYIVFYRPIEDGVEVVRVVHGSRDIEALFEQ
ncbi:MAG: type II toxin-antitoxin system RelE/ParE family toxin [Chloroflexi bacterium]|nr:type II toxin-antitoxin system RelE/ParE family toxin [Chloroflexota bacterium]